MPLPLCAGVILVGHSVGGLICAYFADILAPESNIRVSSVVCLSTPWGGYRAGGGGGGGGGGWFKELQNMPTRVLQGVLTGAPRLSSQMTNDLRGCSHVLKALQDMQLTPANHHKESRPRFYNLAGSLDVVMADSRHIAVRLLMDEDDEDEEEDDDEEDSNNS